MSRYVPIRTAADQDPWRNEARDLVDAAEHFWDELYADADDADWSRRYAIIRADIAAGRFATRRTWIDTDQLAAYDDWYGWLETDRGELLEMNRADQEAWARSYRGAHLVDYLDGDVPAIVVFDTEEAYGVGDGRGRANLAVGLDLPQVPVLLVHDATDRRTA